MKKHRQKLEPLTKAQRAHARFLASVGYTGKKKAKPAPFREEYIKYLDPPPQHLARETSFNGSTNWNKNPLDNRWRRPYRDDEELEKREEIAMAEAEKKFRAVAPTYSKGPLQPICVADIETIGKKI